MKDRLAQLIQYRTGGRKKEFAELCGWLPSYLTKLLNGENFGLQPVLTIIQVIPELNVRWFLTGVGEMIDSRDVKLAEQNKFLQMVNNVADWASFVPILTDDERAELRENMENGFLPSIEPSERESLQRRMNDYQDEMDAKFAAAEREAQMNLCRTQRKPKR